MLSIDCPWCGPRDVAEFTYGGDATLVRPDADRGTDAQWADYVYLRTNPRGAHVEWWHHVAGCRQWLKVHRDTRTHAISGVEAAPAATTAGVPR